MTIIRVFLVVILFSIGSSGWAQETYNNCANAIELCPSNTFTLNNIQANATVCPNCEDDFNFCFSGENSIWMTFTTNATGGPVTAHFNNLVFENLAGQGNGLQAAIIEAAVPCISSSYTLISNCESNGTGNFTLTTGNLPPSTTYYIVVNGTMGATANAEATFDVFLDGTGIERHPQFSISSNQSNICKGEAVTFLANTQLCDEQSTIAWYVNGNLVGTTSDTEFVYTDLSNNDIVTAKVSCFDQCRDTLTSNAIPFTVIDFMVDAGPDHTIHKGESVQLEGNSTETNIIWHPSDHMSNPNAIDPVVIPQETTTYFLTVDNGTCSITDETTVFVEEDLEIPNTFSPNGDGINDTWEILGIEDFPDCDIQIYSRWGQLIFQTTGYSKEKRWDGTSKSGKALSAGAYYYVINLRDDEYDKPIKGTVSIIK